MSLFKRAIEFGKEIYNLSNDENSIIMQSRKTFIFSYGEPRVKQDNENDFEVPIGCYDGAEVYELVDTYLLNQLKVVIAKVNMGLYRDDGLGKFKNMSGSEVERKKILVLVKIFKNNGLSINVKTNLKSADFLDIHYFDLVKEIHQPYKNPMMTLFTLTKNPIMCHQYCSNFRNQSQKEFQKFYQTNFSLEYTPTQTWDENN